MAREQQSGGDARRASARPSGAVTGLRAHRPDTAVENSRTAAPSNADETRRVGRRRAAGPSRGSGATNEDAPSIGGLIFALNQKPTGQPFYYAAIGTGVWAFLGIMIGWVLLGADIAAGRSIGQLLTSPGMVATLTAIAVPIALMWFLALLIWRTQELRLVSSAMTEVAVRLAEPDRQADQAVASLGQSVRRQVSAMNDAISRAIGRAGELEVLVHNEVAALERSYDENEHRIRSLIDELASERDALANNSERVADTLREVGSHLKDEIANAGERAARALSQASSLVADQLNEKGNSLYSSLSVMSEKIGSEVPQLIERLGHEQTQLTRIIDGAGRNLVALESALAQRTGELDAVLNDRVGEFETVISQRFGELDTVLNDRVGEFDSMMAGRAADIESSVGQRSQKLHQLLHTYTNSLNDRLDEVADGLQRTGERVELALTDRTQALDVALVERTRAIDAAFADRMRGLDEHIAQGFEQRLQTFENNLTSGTASIDGALAHRTAALREAMESHAHSLNDILERQSSGLDQTLVRGIESVRRASETITNQSVQTINSLSMQAKFLKEVSEDLLKQMGSLTDRFETQGQSIMQAATAIETSSTRIDGARQNSDAIRRTLEDQLKALDTLSTYSRQAASARDVTPPDASALPSLTQTFQQRAAPRPAPSSAYAPPLPQVAAAPASRPSAPRDTWSLGDLLARASRDDDHQAPSPTAAVAPPGAVYFNQPAAAAQPTQSHANSQPLDLANIAEALDAATASDVWARLRGGETGVLSRGIYSRSGQATFDEILQRYRNDSSFKTMADRYLTDFERLLREADAKDPSGRTLGGHLQGDTGRVYLMLAHASGRFG
jgi:septation ring formation regulator EzrA